jgi:hypothetical protein
MLPFVERLEAYVRKIRGINRIQTILRTRGIYTMRIRKMSQLPIFIIDIGV